MENATSGISLASLLGVVFIVLKLTGVINWAWLWVLAPFWMPLICVIVFFILWCLWVRFF